MFHVKHARGWKSYARLYEKWSPRINLTAASTRDEFWTRHVADSAQLIPLAPEARHWVDLGSGGGFPGMVIAILHGGRSVESGRSRRKQPQEDRLPAGGEGRMCAASRSSIRNAESRMWCRACRSRISSPRGRWPALPVLLDLTSRWLAGGTTGAVSQRPWICRRDRRKPCQMGIRSGTT